MHVRILFKRPLEMAQIACQGIKMSSAFGGLSTPTPSHLNLAGQDQLGGKLSPLKIEPSGNSVIFSFYVENQITARPICLFFGQKKQLIIKNTSINIQYLCTCKIKIKHIWIESNDIMV